jgi:plastocyanin domain-containing protein
MKKLLILCILLGAAPMSLRADGVVKKHHHKRKSQAQTVALFVTGDGFVPAELSVKKGEPVHLVVTRQTDQTCATSIAIPEYGLSQDLPLNVPVTLSFTPKAGGQIRYSCGMGMIQGALTVE